MLRWSLREVRRKMVFDFLDTISWPDVMLLEVAIPSFSSHQQTRITEHGSTKDKIRTEVACV